MAIARCDDHRPNDSEHVGYALPLGYPSTAVTCDVVGCEKPARLWLDQDERNAFVGGTRVFTIGGGVKVRVADDLFPN
ncbi:MAG: hypothetical protein U1E59_17690 [Amaricoccus sp.]